MDRHPIDNLLADAVTAADHAEQLAPARRVSRLGRDLARQVALLVLRLIVWWVAAPNVLGREHLRPHAQRVYFANHRSLGDFLLIWHGLTSQERQCTRVVAAADYWQASALRRFLAQEVFNAVLIDRGADGAPGAMQQMHEVLAAGQSLIIFPEGSRNTTPMPLVPFKPGLHHLFEAFPAVDHVPIWLSNLDHVMPKGAVLPVPMVCTLRFGAPLVAARGLPTADFLSLAAQQLLALRAPD